MVREAGVQVNGRVDGPSKLEYEPSRFDRRVGVSALASLLE